jgi:hypothetical protein
MRRLRFHAVAVLAGFLGVLLFAGVALAKPPGNNGTVKIEGLDLDSIPDNNPHQGCIFTIEFRGYDEGNLNATYSLDVHPPSGNANLTSGTVFIGEDPAGGANDLDATVVINLDQFPLNNFIEHPQQGFHLKLTVHADGSIGSDVKHKVFWVEGCPSYPATPSAPLQNLPASLRTDPPAPAPGVEWGFVVLGALIALSITVVVKQRPPAAKRVR